MYMVLRQETFTDLDLEILEVNYLKKMLSINVNFLSLTIFMLLVVNKQILSGICGCISDYSASNCKIPKLHVL